MADTLHSHLETVKSGIIARLSLRQARLVAGGIATIAAFSVPATAQTVEDVGTAMCGTGVGQVIGFAFIAGSIFYALKAIGQVMSALDKMGSTKQKQAHEGKEKLAGSATTASAAFAPAVAAGIFEVMGINTVSCLSPSSWSIIGGFIALPLPF